MDGTNLLPGMDASDAQVSDAASCRTVNQQSSCSPRLRRPDRAQTRLEPVCLDDRLAADHRARLVWQIVERLDLSRFYDSIIARGSDPGRPATDPKLLAALWLYAAIDNVGKARHLARLCEEHDAYRWLCGGVKVNHHTLSDFRVRDAEALDQLLTQMIVALVDQGLVTVHRISQDSRRTPASAGRSSYRRRKRLEQLEAQAKAHVQALKEQALDEEDVRSPQQRAGQERAAREREQRIEAALAMLPELEAIKRNHTGKPSKNREAQVSTTDAQARRMKLGNGAVAPAYNVQFAVDTASRAVVGVAVVNCGNDQGQSRPMREQVERRTGRKVKEHLIDGGYVKKQEIEHAEQSGTAIYAPLPKGDDGQPCMRGQRDTPGVKAWRERMGTPEAAEIYRERASTSETVNAELSRQRALDRFNVRGQAKVLCAALWSALAYNVIHLGSAFVT